MQDEAHLEATAAKSAKKDVEIIIDEETPLENLKNDMEPKRVSKEMKKMAQPLKQKEVPQQCTDDEIPSDSKELNVQKEVSSKKKNKKERK